jgi:hypothetical protein
MKLLCLIAVATLAFSPHFAEAKPKKKKKEVEVAADTKPPVVTHVRVSRAPKDKALVIRARFEDESEIFAPSIYLRAKGGAEFEALPMRRVENGYEATISADKMAADLEYFIEAFDEQGNGPAREGSPESPLSISVFAPDTAVKEIITQPEVPPIEPPKLEPRDETVRQPEIVAQVPDPKDSDSEEDDNIATTWWFWTIVGVAVTGAVAGTVVLLQNNSGPVDSVDIRVIGPDPAGGLP